MDLGRIDDGTRSTLELPADVADGGAKHAIQQHNFACRESTRRNARETVVLDVRCAVECTAQVHVAVIRVGIADLRVVGARTKRTSGAILEETRAAPPHKVHITLNMAVVEVRLAVDLKRVLIAVKIDVLKDGTGGGRAVEDDGLCLRTALWRGVADREIGNDEVVYPVADEHAAMVYMAVRRQCGAGVGIGAGERIAAGGIEPLVVRIGDCALLAVLADQRDRVLIGEEHHFGISAFAEQDRCGRGIAVGNEVERALHRAEIARASGGDCKARCARSGRGGLGREPPRVWSCQAGKTVALALQYVRVDSHVVGLAAGQRAVFGVDRRLIAGDDHRVVFVIGQSTDGLHGCRRTDVDGLDDGIVGGIENPDLADGAQRRRRGEREPQRRVGANVCGAGGGEQAAHGEARRCDRLRRRGRIVGGAPGSAGISSANTRNARGTKPAAW